LALEDKGNLSDSANIAASESAPVSGANCFSAATIVFAAFLRLIF
jgi:hypothetical protein